MNTQSTQSTLKAAIKDIANLEAISTRTTNNFKPNFYLDTYHCNQCVCI